MIFFGVLLIIFIPVPNIVCKSHVADACPMPSHWNWPTD